MSARSAAQAARRGALLLGGLNQPISASEIQSLRERFTVDSERARAHELPDYYATKEPPGPARLAEMLEESALYSEQLQRISGNVMLGLVVLFAFVFLGIALASVPLVERDTGMVLARIFLASMVFVLSADVLGAWREHWAAAHDIRQIRNRLMVADRAGYPLPDVLLASTPRSRALRKVPRSSTT